MKLFLLAIILVGIAIAGIAIKMFLQKGGQFSKSCSNVQSEDGKKIPCSCHSKEGKCENYEKHFDVTQN